MGLLYIGAEAFFGLAMIVIMLGQAEFYRATRSAGHNPAAALGLIGGSGGPGGVFLNGPSAAGLALFATLAASSSGTCPSPPG